MRLVLVGVTALLLVNLACQSCPDGNKDNSLFCHAANCAANEPICAGACSNPQSDRDNCGKCGNSCGDGLVCSFGVCAEGCAGGLINCNGSCVDETMDVNNCGGCGATDTSHVCAQSESCNNGVCGCAATDITCAGLCTNPLTSLTHCGASGTCAGATAGTPCANNEGCLDGTCTSKLIYRGSLPAGTGRWQYQGTLGLTGANADCAARWSGSAICPYDKLLLASQKATPETINATDYNNVPVTEWWIDDPNATANERCTKNADAIPWSYATQDEGHVGKHVVLTAGTGAISAVITEPLGTGCNVNRFVPCCSIVTAP